MNAEESRMLRVAVAVGTLGPIVAAIVWKIIL